MTSTDGKSLDGDDPLDSPSNDPLQSPLGYSKMPIHMYPFPTGHLPTQPLRSKRRQVKNACTNCQKACKKCDDARPCLRCVKYGISEECVDSQRKERKKGIKRGPYKKRDGKGSSVEQPDAIPPQGLPVSNGVLPLSGSPLLGPYMTPIGLPPGFYGQYSAPQPGPKPGDGPTLFPQYFLAPVPHQVAAQQGAPEADSTSYQHHHPHHQHAQFYPAAFVTQFPPVYPQYVMHPRHDGGGMAAHHYTSYSTPTFHKQVLAGGSSEMGHGGNIREGLNDKSG